MKWRQKHKGGTIRGEVLIYEAEVPGKGIWNLRLTIPRDAWPARKYATELVLRRIGEAHSDVYRTIDLGADQRVQLLREAKKWAYREIYSDLELLAQEAPDWD